MRGGPVASGGGGVTVELLVVLAAALSPTVLSQLNLGLDAPLAALAFGAAVGAVAFFVLADLLFAEQPLAKAVLLGLLVAETMVAHASPEVRLTQVALFLFLYHHSFEGGPAGGH